MLVALAAFTAAGCSPSLDWREFTPEDSGIGVTFPCRPDRQARNLALAGAVVRMEMLACGADGMTFALAYADVADPALVGPGLAALRRQAAGNIGAQAQAWQPYLLAGATPNPQTGRLSVTGALPDGSAVREHAAFFSRGLRLYQASVIGTAPTPAAVDAFLGGFRFST